MNKELMIDYLEKQGWSVVELDSRKENEIWFEIESHSPAGENLVEDLLFTPTKLSFLDALADIYYAFDEKEHVKMWIESNADGVPDVYTLCDDAKEIKGMYRDLYLGATTL